MKFPSGESATVAQRCLSKCLNLLVAEDEAVRGSAVPPHCLGSSTMGTVENHASATTSTAAPTSSRGEDASTADALHTPAVVADHQDAGDSTAGAAASKRVRAQIEEDASLLQQLLEETEAAGATEYVPLKKRKAIREKLLKKQLQALNAHLEVEEGAPGLSGSEQDEEAKQREAKQKEAG